MPDLTSHLDDLCGRLLHMPSTMALLHGLHKPAGTTFVALPVHSIGTLAWLAPCFIDAPLAALVYALRCELDVGETFVFGRPGIITVIATPTDTTMRYVTDPESGWQPLLNPYGPWFDSLNLELLSLLHAHNMKES